MKRSILEIGTLFRRINTNKQVPLGSFYFVLRMSQSQAKINVNHDEEFTKLDLIAKRGERGGREKKKYEKKPVLPPRYKKMSFDQDWPSVWPTAKTFHPASVPLPLHQGYINHRPVAPPGKFANLELMKIPNFLHLSPPAIKRHCEALKKFCTKWPEGLETENEFNENFPIRLIYSDYCHSSPTLRDIRTRIVTLKIKVSTLKLDEHAKDKLIRLAGERYNLETDTLTILTDCCPIKKQNYDYAMYLLTALYFESWNKVPWEAEKHEEDMEKYIWEKSKSEDRLVEVLNKIAESKSEKVSPPSFLSDFIAKNGQLTQDNIASINHVTKYRDITVNLQNIGETGESLDEYGATVRELFNLPPSNK